MQGNTRGVAVQEDFFEFGVLRGINEIARNILYQFNSQSKGGKK